MKKRSGGEGDCGSWMDTYGDMVTLLLCFFVMLYSMSTLNEEKWRVFVQSIHPITDTSDTQIIVNETLGEEDVEGMPELPPAEEQEIDPETLYLQLIEQLNAQGVEGVTVSRGEDYTYIIFQDRAFFEGDSSEITPQGQQILGIFCNVIAPLSQEISIINIMAHTAQGDPNQPNEPHGDRVLSGMRAAEVSSFIQMQNVIGADKLVGISYGQWRPIDTNNTREGRARNRRVEILVVDDGASVRALNEYYEEFNSGVNADKTTVTTGVPAQQETGFALPDGGDEPSPAAIE
ncbi:MAG: flagellar motor protein MotB [Lachnospiraceae bacterium]|nr:flagellar motor protein MotB [Lachnospiraceae bacterium]